MAMTGITPFTHPTIRELQDISVLLSTSGKSSAYSIELMQWANSDPEKSRIAGEIIEQGGYSAQFLELDVESTDIIKDLPYPPNLNVVELRHRSANISEIHDIVKQSIADILESVPPQHQVEINCQFTDSVESMLLQSVLAMLVNHLPAHHQVQLTLTAAVAGEQLFRSNTSSQTHSPNARQLNTQTEPDDFDPEAIAVAIRRSLVTERTDPNYVDPAKARRAAYAASGTTASVASQKASPELIGEIRQVMSDRIAATGGLKIGGKEVGLDSFMTQDSFAEMDPKEELCLLNTNGVYSIMEGSCADALLGKYGSKHPLTRAPLSSADFVRGEALLKLLKEEPVQTTST